MLKAEDGLILRHHEAGVLTLTLSRPAKRNAITLAMYEHLQAELLGTGDDTRVVVITAEGDYFTAGNDIGDFRDRVGSPAVGLSPALRFIRALAGTEVPVIAAVPGPAIGIGTTLLLHCDIVIATDTARFATPFAALGLTPEAASSVLLPATVGSQTAARMLLAGEALDARQALEAGLVSQVLDSRSALEERVAELTASIVEQPREAVRLGKQLLRRAGRQLVLETIEHEAGIFAERLSSDEARQAFERFLSKG